jgi:hypothetical protein
MRASVQIYIEALDGMRQLCMGAFQNLEKVETELAPVRVAVTEAVPQVFPELLKPGRIVADALLVVVKQSEHYRNAWIELDQAISEYQEALRNLPE